MNDENAAQGDKREEVPVDTQPSFIDFIYDDADSYAVEIAEAYSYSEEPEFYLNYECFDSSYLKHASVKWFEATESKRKAHFIRLIDQLDSAQRANRQTAIRALLYLAQGNFKECQLEEDQLVWAKRNVFMAIDLGLYASLVQLLLYEIDYDNWPAVTESSLNSSLKESAMSQNRPSTMSSSSDLRALLSLLYIMVETVRSQMIADGGSNGCGSEADGSLSSSSGWQCSTLKLCEQFCEELGSPIACGPETTLTIVLFGMVHRFCSGLAPHFPMRKVLLLLWKTNLIILGPITTAFAKKNEARARWNLPPLFEDSHQIISRLRPCSPPGSSIDQLLSRSPRTNTRHTVFGQGNQVPKRGSLAGGQHIAEDVNLMSEDASSILGVNDKSESEKTVISDKTITLGYGTGMATPRPSSPVSDSSGNDFMRADTPMPGPSGNKATTNGQNMAQTSSSEFWSVWRTEVVDHKSLPWKPKVYKRDLEAFLTAARLKFVNFRVSNDTTSLIGLPEPIHEAVRVLREHIYVPLSEVQIQKEMLINYYPLTMGRDEIPDTPTERLYRAIYPQLPQYAIALLRILLAAVPTSKLQTEPINILAEITPDALPTDSLQMSVHYFDLNRHREVIVKAISALLLLLLKHLKMNHIYQFEYAAQYLVFANCIPLILKFFNQNTSDYVHAKNSLSSLDFPSRFIGSPSELTDDMLITDWNPYCWRNLFACINLLRILNMLTKWKDSRTMLMVVFKSAPILKRALKVRHAMLQLYVLKLFKLQSRYFGRQWRRNNMSITSAIYRKVRHHFVDDWAYGSDIDAVPMRFQADEQSLRNSVDQFNQRKYIHNCLDPIYRPVDNCLSSVLSQPFTLSDEFKQNYEKWLEEEVFSVPINWSQVLSR